MISLIPYEICDYEGYTLSVYSPNYDYEEKKGSIKVPYYAPFVDSTWPHNHGIYSYSESGIKIFKVMNGDDHVLTLFLDCNRDFGLFYKTLFNAMDSRMFNYERNKKYQKIIFAPKCLKNELGIKI